MVNGSLLYLPSGIGSYQVMITIIPGNPWQQNDGEKHW
jgi:hypothetical protein